MQKIKDKYFKIYTALVLSTSCLQKVRAEEDPIAIINNLSDLIFEMMSGVGVIIMSYGIFQFSIALSAHDGGQKSNSILYIIGGAVIVCSKVFLKKILGQA